MRKKRLMVGCWLLLLSLCLTNSAGQKSEPYPKNADDIIAFIEVFSRVDYSVNDAIQHLGSVDPASHHDFRISLKPFPSERDKIEKVVLDTFGETREASRKLDAVRIEYLKPIQVSYGELTKKYGAPAPLPLPRVKCPTGVNCHPAFVGYRFSFMPAHKDSASGKRFEVSISLEMEWSKVVPQHTDKDFLAVKAIRFKRIWRVQARPL